VELGAHAVVELATFQRFELFALWSRSRRGPAAPPVESTGVVLPILYETDSASATKRA
jgi:hypothetical protein